MGTTCWPCSMGWPFRISPARKSSFRETIPFGKRSRCPSLCRNCHLECIGGIAHVERADPPQHTRGAGAAEAVLATGRLEWCTVDVDSAVHVKELYELLSNHYVEDNDATFRFNYSPDFLRWYSRIIVTCSNYTERALKPPGWKAQWHVGIRSSTGDLVAFIAAVPASIRVYDK